MASDIRDVEEELAWVQAQLPPRQMRVHADPGAMSMGVRRLTTVTAVTAPDSSPALAAPPGEQPGQQAECDEHGCFAEDGVPEITEPDAWRDEAEPDGFEPDDDPVGEHDGGCDEDEPLSPG